MHSQKQNELTGVLLVVAGSVLLAAKGVVAKLLYAEGLRVETLLAMRSGLALPLFWAWATWRDSLLPLRRIERRPLWIAIGAGVGCYYIGAVTDFRALTLIPASLERTLLYVYPSLIVLIIALRDRRLPAPELLFALALTYAGVVLAIGGADPQLWRENSTGALLVMVSAVTYALFFFANEFVGRRIGSRWFIVIVNTAGTTLLVVHFLVVLPLSALDISARAWALLAFMVVFITVIPVFMIGEGVTRIGAQRGALVSTVGPPSTVLMAALVLGEQLRWFQFAGIGAVLLGLYMLERQRAVAPVAE
jgi:drug/metabolite transporter (DMT)-like permease